MEMFLVIVLYLLLGWLTSHLAQRRGRDPVAWFLIGMFLGLIGIVILFLLPERKKKTEGLNEEEERLEPHGETIEIEVTKEASQQEPSEELSIRNCNTKEWYYLDQDHKQQGPIGFDFLKAQWAQQKVQELTYVWCEGMADWKKIKDLPMLRDAFLEQ